MSAGRWALVAFAVLLLFFLLTAALIVGGEAVSANSCATAQPSAGAEFDGREQPPGQFRNLYVEAADRYRLGPRGPAILAAIHKIESGFGQNMGPSSAGAIGHMQFLPSTWQRYGVDADGDGRRDPYSAADAIFSAARYLRASGAPADWYGAIFAYNHADWYVQDVLDQARRFGDAGAISDVECTAEAGADLDRAIKVYEPREYRPLPRWAMAAGRAPQAVDARIYANVLYLLRIYDLRVTAAREAGHASHGDGQAIDVIPASGNSAEAWERTAERAARDLGWRPRCGRSGVAPACPLSPAIRFIGYDGYPNHGAGNHLHISWQSSSGGSAALAPPAEWVMAFASAGA